MTIEEEIKEYMLKNNLNASNCAEKLGLSVEQVESMETKSLELTEESVSKIREIISQKQSTGRKIVKTLDLIFRFGACIMALAALLLCINGTADYKILTVLLSIGLVCSSITGLPKIDK